MADNYDSGGYISGNYKPNIKGEDKMHKSDVDIDKNYEQFYANGKAAEYIKELLSEKVKLNSEKFPFTIKLIDQEVQRLQANERVASKDNKYMDVLHEKPVRVAVKALVPSREYPNFNFVGKLLGPKGNNMKQLQENTLCKMAVLGRGSMKDRQKEDSLRSSHDPKFAHLCDELHVEISALAPPAEAHARIAYALAEVKKYLIPDFTETMRPNINRRHIMDRSGPPLPHAHGMPHRSHSQSPMVRTPSKSKTTSILERAHTIMESYGYEADYRGTPKSLRCEPSHHPLQSDPDYYEEHYYDNDEYLEDDPVPTHEYKQSLSCNVGTRQHGSEALQQPQRRAGTSYTRTTPYTRRK